ncbi:hypothetical protein AB0I68_11380 [Streptomyces sp. NPDC050448]|uniref:hypothetical protein n=1 Tax=Streptomyces sp. NPDC050448 TaxID=3155404 RepID=UPI00341BA371
MRPGDRQLLVEQPTGKQVRLRVGHDKCSGSGRESGDGRRTYRALDRFCELLRQ